MREISSNALREVLDAWERYKAGIDSHDHNSKTKDTYISRASYFTRSLQDGFYPCER